MARRHAVAVRALRPRGQQAFSSGARKPRRVRSCHTGHRDTALLTLWLSVFGGASVFIRLLCFFMQGALVRNWFSPLRFQVYGVPGTAKQVLRWTLGGAVTEGQLDYVGPTMDGKSRRGARGEEHVAGVHLTLCYQCSPGGRVLCQR